jgi:type II secretion system protein L
VSVETSHIAVSPFEVLCSQLCSTVAEKQGINFLQGDFKQEFRKVGANIRWKPVAVLLVAWLSIFMGTQIGQSYYYSAKADSLDKETKAYYKKLFPGAKKVKNVKRMMSSKIREANSAKTGVGFMPLLGATGQFVYELNKRKKDTVQLQRITFDEKQGALRVDMRVSNFNDLDKLKGQIEGAGLKVNIDAATKDADKVKARLRIKG